MADYSEPVAIVAPMRAAMVAGVVQSRHPDFVKGEILCGIFGWQGCALGDGSEVRFRHDASLDLPLGRGGVQEAIDWLARAARV